MSEIPFIVGEKYTRKDIYEIFQVPEEAATRVIGKPAIIAGATIFSSSRLSDHQPPEDSDYANRWEGDIFIWYAKQKTKLSQPQIQWMLREAKRVFIFTRPAVRHPFTFEGLGTPESWEDETPVLIRWRVESDPGTKQIFPEEVTDPETYTEGATRQGYRKRI